MHLNALSFNRTIEEDDVTVEAKLTLGGATVTNTTPMSWTSALDATIKITMPYGGVNISVDVVVDGSIKVDAEKILLE